MKKWLRAVAFAVTAAFVLGGVTLGPANMLVMTGASAQQPAAATAEYRLGVADKVRVTVFGEEKLSGEFQVGANGSVALPLIGETRAQGLTTSEVQAAVTTALAAGYLRDPKVSIEVLNYRPFYILGEVKRPGEYPYTNSLTVLNAVATAEGFTYRADTKKVYIKRANSAAEQAYPLTSATPVAPGDTIRIGERYF